jgi:hypothetical protein
MFTRCRRCGNPVVCAVFSQQLWLLWIFICGAGLLGEDAVGFGSVCHHLRRCKPQALLHCLALHRVLLSLRVGCCVCRVARLPELQECVSHCRIICRRWRHLVFRGWSICVWPATVLQWAAVCRCRQVSIQ